MSAPFALGRTSLVNEDGTPTRAGLLFFSGLTQKDTPDLVSVKDYGAKGDGVTDDAPFIRLALATGLDVYFPDGTYLLNSFGTTFSNNSWVLTPASNQTLYSSGHATLKMANGFINSSAQTFGGGMILLHNVSNVKIHDLLFDMNGANNLVPLGATRNAIAIKGASATNVEIYFSSVINSPGSNAITFDSASSYVSIHHNTFTGGGTSLAGNTNQTDWSAIYTEADHSDISHNVIDNSASGTYPRGPAGGIELHGSFNRASQNDIGYAYPAFYVNPPTANGTQSHVAITSNRCTFIYTGVIVGASVNGTILDFDISGNSFSLTTGSWPAGVQAGATSYGVFQYNSNISLTTFATITSAKITGNIIREDDPAPLATQNAVGISVNTLNSSTISHNTVQNIGAHGIQVIFTSRGVRELLIDNNVITDFGQNTTGFPNAAIILNGSGSESGVTITNNIAGLTTASGNAYSFYLDWGVTTLNALTIANNTLRNITNLTGGGAVGTYTAAIPGYTLSQWSSAASFPGLVTAGALTVTGAAGNTDITGVINTHGNIFSHGGDIVADQFVHGSNLVADTGNIRTLLGSFVTGANTGLTTTLTVRNSSGAGTCTITIEGGIITATTC